MGKELAIKEPVEDAEIVETGLAVQETEISPFMDDDVISEKKTWEEICELGRQANQTRENSQWILGDLALEVEVTYGGDSIGKFAREINAEKETIMRYRTVAKAWPPELREKFKNVDGEYLVSHRHFMIATPMANREWWVEQAILNTWSTKDLELEIKRSKGEFDVKLAVTSVSLSRGEIDEIIRWFNEINVRHSHLLNDFSLDVKSKMDKALDKAIKNSEE